MKRSFQTNTYAYLYHCAKWTREQPIPPDKSGYERYRRISYVTFLALTYEAFLNHCGFEKVSWWQFAERTMSTDAKLEVILSIANVTLKKGERPRQTLATLTKLRNEIAHGKTVSLPFPAEQAINSPNRYPKWLVEIESCDLQCLHDDLYAFVTLIYKALGFQSEHPRPFELMGVTRRET